MDVTKLPEWARFNESDGMVEVTPSKAYPLFLSLLDYDIKTVTQAQLESARMCFTEILHIAIGKKNKLFLRILRDKKFALSNFKPGTPISWAADFQRLLAKMV